MNGKTLFKLNYYKYSPTTLIAPLTSVLTKKKLLTHVFIEGNKYNLKSDSVILLEQYQIIDKNRLMDFYTNFDADKMNEVDAAIMVSFGLVNKKAV